MVVGFHLFRLALLSGVVLAALSSELAAATSSTLDVISADRAPDDTVEIGRITPIARPDRETAKALPSGNPLWAIPLSALSATLERPIFSASRRPQRAVVAAVEVGVVAPPEKPLEPDRPDLTLIGAVVGDSDAIAVFIDRTNQKIIRLKRGDNHSGWVLSAVQGREVTLKKADRSETLVLHRQEGTAAGPAGVPGQEAPGPSVPTAGGLARSYAPFTPRSTPKNGESDGL